MTTDSIAENSPSGEGVARLALVTCGPQLEVALACPSSEAVSLVRLGGVAPRSTLVLAAVDLLVEDAGMKPGGVREVVVSRGPGSFTGIRAGLATAAGLVAAVDATCLAFDSLTMLAARCDSAGEVWSAQPGRRGEVYARQFDIVRDVPPRALTEIEVLPVSAAADRGPWVTAEALDLGDVTRAVRVRSSAEALLRLVEIGAPPDLPEPLYVEGPPFHSKAEKG
jgi:tRNA threonylcarbamoyl adenosine modification protein YeaZ